MDRRALFSIAIAALALPGALLAQTANRVFRIVVLNDGDESTRAADWKVFRERLGKLGIVEGKNLTLEFRHARGRNDVLSKLAVELAGSAPDIVVSAGTPASHAMKAATSTIPLVFIAVGDPVGTGLVKSLARPGGNGTGVSVVTTEIAQKSLELLRELVPGIQRVAFIGDPSNPAYRLATVPLQEVARKVGVVVQMLSGADPAALEQSIATIRRERLQGLYVDASGRVLIYRDKILEFAAREKLPAVYGRHDYTDAGGLLSYETDRRSTFVRGAEMVHSILKGAKPGDLPVEQTSEFRMVVNLRTARAQGIAIPSSIRVRADEVIE